MNEPFRMLDGLTAIIQTDEAVIPRFVVASVYETPGSGGARRESSPANDEDDEEKESILSSHKTYHDDTNGETVASITGTWTVTVGCEKGWWSTSLDTQALQDLLGRPSVSTSKATYPTRSDIKSFTKRITSAYDRKSILFGGIRTKDPSSWGAVKLFLNPESDPVELKLHQLSQAAALDISTKLILTSSLSFPSAATASFSSSAFEIHQLRRKLESTQQALREERHKYRSLLAAPSAVNSRTGRRTVVGLGPSLPSVSQRTQSQMISSSPSSGSRSRGGVASSSSGVGPSSEDLASISGDNRKVGGSQRTLSLVNPTRVQRANPGENDGFIGDDDDDDDDDDEF
ncbi:uncharacterized protein UBRO_06526 [Ustilago bromivora]|uniref:Uncharacterized protein n=1 Tax=Ustilago bromivora TaxID=307758 RepID=A0A1K0HGM2_9BASI|nr:uncharacterized protein UBRO_06526 [Ustilago bromivora]SYW73734.1 uncharacterized protein UBRO2_00009 [Ustilago bromivora]